MCRTRRSGSVGMLHLFVPAECLLLAACADLLLRAPSSQTTIMAVEYDGGVREEPWVCSSCGFSSFGWRSSCYKRAKKQEGKVAVKAMPSAPAPKALADLLVASGQASASNRSASASSRSRWASTR